MEKKITLATFKKFLRENLRQAENLFINVTSSFDGMVDCCTGRKDGWKPVVKGEDFGTQIREENTLGISGVWLVGRSRDCFERYEDENFIGIHVYNCCGAFNLAIKKA